MSDAVERKFSRNISDFVQVTKISVDVVLRKLALDAYSQVQQRSPVDTGRFKSNWRLSIKKPDLTTRKTPVAGSSEKGVPIPAYLTSGISKLEEAKAGNTIYITNNLPYAKRLEDGWSKQAAGPGGILQASLDTIIFDFDKTVNAVKEQVK